MASRGVSRGGSLRANLSRRRLLLLAGAFLLALAAAIFFGVRLLIHTLYWASHRDEPIEEWMWVGYVARSHQAAPAVLLAALGLPTDIRDRRPLGEIAREQNKQFGDIRTLLEAAIAEEKRKATEAPALGQEP